MPEPSLTLEGGEPMTEKQEDFLFSSAINPHALTQEIIEEITNAIAKQVATEAAEGLQSDQIDPSFHIRIGGQHSREFSRTRGPNGHRNVIHSNVIVGGGGPEIPG
jgi:hypothetical protein